MRDETPPWVGTVDDSAASSVDPFVLAGTTLWLVVFGWYVILQAAPRAGLSFPAAALVYSVTTLLAGVCFGWGEEQLSAPVRRVFDRSWLLLGAAGAVTTTLTWFILASPSSPYEAGLWMGAVFLGAGIAFGARLQQ